MFLYHLIFNLQIKMARNFEFLENVEDVEFQALGQTLEEAFSNCALAVSKTLCKGLIKRKKSFRVQAYGKDNESLLYNFLEELLYLFDTEHFIWGRVTEMKIKDNRLTAKVAGDDVEKYEKRTPIKSPAHSGMSVKKEDGKWTAHVVLDIKQ